MDTNVSENNTVLSGYSQCNNKNRLRHVRVINNLGKELDDSSRCVRDWFRRNPAKSIGK